MTQEIQATTKAERIAQRAQESAAIEARLTNPPALTIKKADKAELALLIEREVAAYQLTVEGRDTFTDASGRPQMTEFNEFGAIEFITAYGMPTLFAAAQAKIDQGYKLYTGGVHEFTHADNNVKMYVVKGEVAQAKDIEALTADVTAKYEAFIDAHNEKVFEQERAAMLVEEEEARKALQREDAAKAEAEFEKRVQARIRGLRGAK